MGAQEVCFNAGIEVEADSKEKIDNAERESVHSAAQIHAAICEASCAATDEAKHLGRKSSYFWNHVLMNRIEGSVVVQLKAHTILDFVILQRNVVLVHVVPGTSERGYGWIRKRKRVL